MITVADRLQVGPTSTLVCNTYRLYTTIKKLLDQTIPHDCYHLLFSPLIRQVELDETIPDFKPAYDVNPTFTVRVIITIT